MLNSCKSLKSAYLVVTPLQPTVVCCVSKHSVEVATDRVLPPRLRQLNLHGNYVTPPVSRDRKKADFNACGQSREIIPQPFIEQDVCELTNAPSTRNSRAMLHSDASTDAGSHLCEVRVSAHGDNFCLSHGSFRGGIHGFELVFCIVLSFKHFKYITPLLWTGVGSTHICIVHVCNV